jgi:hypothetical protein
MFRMGHRITMLNPPIVPGGNDRAIANQNRANGQTAFG